MEWTQARVLYMFLCCRVSRSIVCIGVEGARCVFGGEGRFIGCNNFHEKVGLSVCVAAGVKPMTTVTERCGGARVRPNPSCPLPLGHCWDGQTHLAPVSLKLTER